MAVTSKTRLLIFSIPETEKPHLKRYKPACSSTGNSPGHGLQLAGRRGWRLSRYPGVLRPKAQAHYGKPRQPSARRVGSYATATTALGASRT
eukprot:3185124-Rhodomonas_salina.1